MVLVIDERVVVNSPVSDGMLENVGQSGIKKIEQDETVTIKRPVNHNEVSLMENDWQRIKDKINAITLKKKIDLSAIVVGAIIPYSIDIIVDFIKNETPNFFPLCICVVLLIIIRFLARYLPWLGEDKVAENKVHLEDLKSMVTYVEKSLQSKH